MKRCGKCHGINVPQHSTFCPERWPPDKIYNWMCEEMTRVLGPHSLGPNTLAMIKAASETLYAQAREMYRLMEQQVANEIFIGESPSAACQHEYATYHGFNESYQYCKLCDHKKEIPK